MDFDLNDDQKLLYDQITKFAQQELSSGVVERDRDQNFPHDLWLKCGEMGLQGLPVPEELGGAGLDPVSTAIALEALGYGCRDGGLVFAICAHLLACVVPVWKHGSADQKKRYLADLCSGTKIAVNGMTEPGTGSDAFSMKTRAEPKDSGFVINGNKMFSSNGPIADVAIVYASTDRDKGYHGGVTAFLIETDTPGFKAGQKFEKMGLHSCPIGELVMEDVYVPAEAVLGNVGDGAAIFSESMDWERACLVAAHVGTIQWLLEQAIEYAKLKAKLSKDYNYGKAIENYLAGKTDFILSVLNKARKEYKEMDYDDFK